jgi:uncharacterized sporulation protein YeaH/YhbH (DUF444 family)
MSLPTIIDRRKNPSQKSLSNRQRFIERFRDQIKDSAKRSIKGRSISDSGDQEVSIDDPSGIDEPHFRNNPDFGERDIVLPGNDGHLPGDSIKKPQSDTSDGRGGAKKAEGEDEFTFLLSYDEYLNMIFDGLELPDLIKTSDAFITTHQLKHAGFTTTGVPTNLNIERTAIAGLSRRIALKSPKILRIAELEKLLEEETDEEKRTSILAEIEELRIRSNAIRFLDNVDLRYNNFVPQPKPITKAVMFCIMDISYSMGEREKTISKKFFLLLHLFLKKKYKDLDVIFIRHHEEASECSEQEFFTSRSTGGTMVSTAYDLTKRIIDDRYPVSDWNIYVAQTSDGDNYDADNEVCAVMLDKLLPLCQFFSYIEIVSPRDDGFIYNFYSNTTESFLWEIIHLVANKYSHVEMEQIVDEDDIVAVFRSFFERKIDG